METPGASRANSSLVTVVSSILPNSHLQFLICKGGRGPVKNKPIVLPDGTIIAPASLETPDGNWNCFTDSSHDQGKTWTRSAFAQIDRATWPGEGAIQPSLINSAPGKLTMLSRSSAGYVARSDSEDNGKNWGKMYLTPLFNNNSGLDALRQENGTWLLVHNPVQQRWVSLYPELTLP